jgi:uncharacterized protein
MWQQAFYYLSYLALPITVAVVYFIVRTAWRLREKFSGQLIIDGKPQRGRRVVAIWLLILLLCLLFDYARFIEPNIILTHTTSVPVGFSGRLVLIADIHLGVYKGENFLARLVQQINQLPDVDAVLVAGDWAYFLPPDQIDQELASLKDLKYPVYAVMGNHDNGTPGEDVSAALTKALTADGVVVLNNEIVKLPKNNITLVGLGDRWSNSDDVKLLEKLSPTDNVVVLTHNPDTSLLYNQLERSVVDLTLTGHTHGGQMRIPLIYHWIIPTVGDFDEGMYAVKGAKVFVTGGVGEVWLPMRLGIPPTVEILELK